MKPFLKAVADDIYDRFNGNLADVAVVFPNKRAGLFFNEYLLQRNSGRPLWSPVYITISEFFEQCSDSLIGDTIVLVSKLYKAYCKHSHSDESIDKFYHWGELMIKDFDDIDKNLADASSLFANLHDLRSMGSAADTLDPEQRHAIEQFFDNLKPQEQSELKRRFLHTWEVMGDIYNTFRDELRNEGIAYEGMLYRNVIENEALLQFPYKRYIFVGFNALNRVESRLFDIMQQRGLGLFYWDYDNIYIDDDKHEAGRFMRRNLQRYPNALSADSFSFPKEEKRIEVISTTSDSIQTRFASQWIEKNITQREVETAIILCNEGKLESILHAVPPVTENINITMGFPISHTPAYSLVQRIIDLQSSGYDSCKSCFTMEAVHNILSHPYVKRNSAKAAETDKVIIEKRLFFPPIEMLHSDELMSLIFRRHTDNALWIASIGNVIRHIANNIGNDKDKPGLYEELYREALLKVFTLTQRFIAIIESGELPMKQQNIGRLFMRVLSSASMPFHGEPVAGMQVMGLLETRNLDFKNILLLSANEGNMPKKSSDTSFVPYNLRRAFGLTLSEHRDSIYAYNFHRLIQRASKVTLVYNSSPGLGCSGECSRYILQLQAGGYGKIKRAAIETPVHNSDLQPQTIHKSREMINRLRNIYDMERNATARVLSPSAINCYLHCPLKFCYRYVMGLRITEEVTTSIDSRDFGNIFHKAAELLYNEITSQGNGIVDKGDLEKYIKEDYRLAQFIDRAFNEEFFKNKENGKPVYDGEQYINREVLIRFMKRLVKMDIQHTPFRYGGSEQDIFFDFSVPLNDGGCVKLRLGGRIDRIDIKDGVMEIIDYKTGGKEEIPTDLKQVFAHDGKHMDNIFQALLYSVAALESGKAAKVSPSLVRINSKSAPQREDFVVKIKKMPISDVSPMKAEFEQMLATKLSEIFDEATPYTPTEDATRCEWCDFKKICGR